MSKFFKTLALSACLASFAFAQDDDYNSYSSDEESSYEASSEESSDEGVSSAEDEESYNDAAPLSKKRSDDDDDDDEVVKQWFVNVHPITTVFFTLAGIPTIFVTVEKTYNDRLSIIGRPFFMYASGTADGVDVSMGEFGLQGGARWYVGPGHRGFYVDGLANIMYASLSASDSDDYLDASAFGLGLMALAGWKYDGGSWDFGVDIGIGYTLSFASASSSSSKESIEDLSTAGFSFDMNIYVGLGF